MASTLTEIGTLIARDPGVHGGRPLLAGTGVSVRVVAIDSNGGLSPEEIAADRPELSLAQVFAALTYYHANRAEIDEDIGAEALAYANGAAASPPDLRVGGYEHILDWSQCGAVQSVPGKVSGALVFKDTRMPVAKVFENLEAGLAVDEVMEEFSVTREQIRAVLRFAVRSLRTPL